MLPFNRAQQIVVCVCVALLLSPSTAGAQIFIEEGKIELDVTPGENVTGKLLLYNTSDQKVSAKVYWEDFEYIAPYDGSKNFLAKGTSSTSMGEWVSYSPKEVTLSPFGKAHITYAINVPDAMDKGHYGVLFIEREDIGLGTGEKGLKIVSRVGALFFVEPKNKVKAITLDNITLGKAQVAAVFQNNGNVVLLPEGIYYVMDRVGMIFDRGKIDKIYIPAGAQTDYVFDIKQDLAVGRYSLVLTFDVGNGDAIVKEIDFEKVNSSEYKIIEIRD